MDFKDLFQAADWKIEKHSPVIELPVEVKKGEFFKITAAVGREIVHPNKAEHHIRWIEVYFLPEGEKLPYQVARVEFSAHGESAKGPDTSTVYTHPEAVLNFKTEKPGTVYAFSYCNIHGLWQSAKGLQVK